MKQKRYWLKGGICGLIVGIIFSWIPMILSVQNPILEWLLESCLKIIQIISYPISVVFCKGTCVGEQVFGIIITGPITGIILGSVIGFLYGKFKNRDKINI